MDKGTHFIGQPAFGQLISLLDKSKILKISREVGGERYVKKFDAWQHLVIMLYAIIKRFDSLREISDSMFPEARKLAHIGVRVMPRRSTLSDANSRRSEKVFTNFLKMVEENCRKERRVAWYAQQQNITPKYLSEAVKRVSGRTAVEWVENYVTMELRVLLKNSTKTIKEIANEMNFPNQSFLGKYFREHVGVTPSEYRKS